MTSEFLVFLQKLDKADYIDDDECGRASELEFVLAVKQLEDVPEEKKAECIQSIGAKYFKQDGLDLDNKKLWKRCSEACSEAKETESGLACLQDAHDKCLDKLDTLQLNLALLKSYLACSKCGLYWQRLFFIKVFSCNINLPSHMYIVPSAVTLPIQKREDMLLPY